MFELLSECLLATFLKSKMVLRFLKWLLQTCYFSGIVQTFYILEGVLDCRFILNSCAKDMYGFFNNQIW